MRDFIDLCNIAYLFLDRQRLCDQFTVSSNVHHNNSNKIQHIKALLLNQCVEMSPRPKDLNQPQKFWRWNTFDQYVKFLLIFTGGIGFFTFLSKIIWIPFYGTILGFASLSLQATLGFPQLTRNHQTKSVQGLSFFMIFTWFAGDFMKTLYFITQSQPIQFIMCGAIQLTVDILIILQIINYKKIDPKLYLYVPDQSEQPKMQVNNQTINN